jgi:hypothetical protein
VAHKLSVPPAPSHEPCFGRKLVATMTPRGPHRRGLAMLLRAIVLVLCLGSAAGIAAYSYYSRGDTGEPVYTLPPPSSAPAPYMAKASGPEAIAPDDVGALARALQRELKRVGCYNGEVSGAWTMSSRLAMKTFLEHVNAALPVDKPDPVLLSLVQGHRERVCAPGTVTAATVKEAPPDATKDEAKADAGKTGTAAAASAAAAVAASGKPDVKPLAPEAGPQSGAPDGKPPRRPRRSVDTTPKVVRDLMKLFGSN